MSESDMKDEPVSTTEASCTDGRQLSSGVNSAIGQRLRAYYDDVASEPVPDKFLSLLDALDAAEEAASSRRGDK